MAEIKLTLLENAENFLEHSLSEAIVAEENPAITQTLFEVLSHEVCYNLKVLGVLFMTCGGFRFLLLS